jgi:hypothetical protein
MTAAFGELSEALGTALLPLFEALVPLMTGFFEWMGRNANVVVILASAFTALSVAILAVNFALNANPIVKIITLIAALATGVILLVNHLVELYGGWSKLFAAIGKGLTEVGNFFKTVFEGVTAFMAGIINGLATRFQNFINTVIGGLNGIISLANSALSIVSAVTGGAINIKVPTVPKVVIPKVPVKTPKPPKVKDFANGGIVMPRPGGLIGRIAEAGQAEAVIPLNKMDKYTNSKPQNVYNITVNGGLGSGAQIGKSIVEVIKAYERSSGAVWQSA